MIGNEMRPPEGGDAIRVFNGQPLPEALRVADEAAKAGIPFGAGGDGGVKRDGTRGASTAGAGGDGKLMARVFERCHDAIARACATSSIPPAFLGALAAAESGGAAGARQFEPAVYRHLKALAVGLSPAYAGGRPDGVARPHAAPAKSDEYHRRFMSSDYVASRLALIADLTDAGLRDLATAWGLTRVMGYHALGRSLEPRALLDPALNFRVALALLSEFAETYQLDLTREFGEMFRCWATGGPYGLTRDPEYADKGARRMEMYRRLDQAAQKLENRGQEPGIRILDSGAGIQDSRFRSEESRRGGARCAALTRPKMVSRLQP